MKKGIFVLVLACLSVLLFSSCSINKFVFDDSVPAEQLAEIEIQNVGAITGYNGIPVDWRATGFYVVYRIKIPAGDTLFEFDVLSYAGNTTFTGKGILFKYNFQPNKMYILDFSHGEDQIGLNVYTFEIGEKTPGFNINPTDPHFTEFVPFVNAQGNQKTVLE